MHAPSGFDYAVIRIVPRVERGEFINAGIVVQCATQDFLEAQVWLDGDRLHALWPEVDLTDIAEHLSIFPRIAAGDRTAGPIAQLPRSQRFHWLTAPRSTVIQTSPIHSGICTAKGSVVTELMKRLVLP